MLVTEFRYFFVIHVVVAFLAIFEVLGMVSEVAKLEKLSVDAFCTLFIEVAHQSPHIFSKYCLH